MAIAVLIASFGVPLAAQRNDRLVADPDMLVKDRFLAGRQVVVYLDPSAYALAAAYVDTDGITWEEKVLYFYDTTLDL